MILKEKKLLIIIWLINLFLINFTFLIKAQDEEEIYEYNKEKIYFEDEKNTLNSIALPVKRIFLQIGAIESKSGNKYILRKKNSKLEFFIEEKKTKIFLKEKSLEPQFEKGNFLILRGPNNKKGIIVNTAYIFKNKETFEQYSNQLVKENYKINEITGTVLNVNNIFEKLDENLRPSIIETSSGKLLFLYDDSTYWVSIKEVSDAELKSGDRVTLYFDQRISLRTKNIPFKVIINKVDIGY